jgi:hypothetical protein
MHQDSYPKKVLGEILKTRGEFTSMGRSGEMGILVIYDKSEASMESDRRVPIVL